MTAGFEGKVAVVTGGTGALGRAVCAAFRDAGARVVAVARSGAPREQDGVHVEPVDLTDEAACLRLGETVRERYGRCDALVCAAGGYEAAGPVAGATLDEWRRQLDLNATSAFLTCRALLPLLCERPGGAVVLVSSRSALRPQAGAAPYVASKAAVIALAQTLALELRPAGARANAVLPSVLDTPANRASMPGADTSRWVSTEDAARAILWLCSADASTISGAAVPIYGNA